jgi:hypothetical protein
MGFIYHPWVTHQTLENSPRSISAQHITELREANNQYTLSNPSSPSPSPISQTRTHNHNPSGGSLLHYPVQTRERETGDGRDGAPTPDPPIGILLLQSAASLPTLGLGPSPIDKSAFHEHFSRSGASVCCYSRNWCKCVLLLVCIALVGFRCCCCYCLHGS